MARLFNRYLEITAGLPGQQGRVWLNSPDHPGLEATFDVAKTGKRGSNKATIKFANLSDDSVGVLEQKGAVISVVAGYVDQYAQIFSGDIAKRGVTTVWEGPTRWTTIEAGNGETALRNTRSDLAFSAGATSREVLDEIVTKMGLGAGNTADLDEIEFQTGFTHVGQARALLDEVANMLGVRWSVQNGQVQFLKPGDTTKDQAVLLSAASGLVGAPARAKRGIEAKALLTPEIFPGRRVKIDSRTITAFYKVSTVQHLGDIRGNDWYTTFKGTKLKGQ